MQNTEIIDTTIVIKEIINLPKDVYTDKRVYLQCQKPDKWMSQVVEVKTDIASFSKIASPSFVIKWDSKDTECI